MSNFESFPIPRRVVNINELDAKVTASAASATASAASASLSGSHADNAAASAATAIATTGTLPRVNRNDMKALDTSAITVAYLNEALRQGLFQWDASILVATHQADTDERTFIAPDAAANGAWVRQTGASPEIVAADDVVSLKPSVAGRALPMRSRFQLADPATVKNEQVLHLGQPPAPVFGDGAKWWNLTTGAEVTPWWLPRGAVLHVDFENGRFYWDGAIKALSDLTDNGDGSYDLAYGAWFTGAATVACDFEIDYASGNPSGEIFSWTSASFDRIEIGAFTGSGVAFTPRIYISPTGQFHSAFWNIQNNLSGTSSTEGRRRIVASFASSQAPIVKADNWNPQLSLNALGTLSTPSKLTFGRRARFNDNRLTNATLQSVTIWSRRLIASELEMLGRDTLKWPVHLLGDSFLNTNRIYGNLAKDFAASKYIPITQDGVGGSSLADQATRYVLDERTAGGVTYDDGRYHDATLVICEFGLDGTARQTIPALKKILGKIKHDRWLFMEPAPNQSAGTAGRIAGEEHKAKLREFCGDRWVSTLDKAQALSDGSAGDLAELAKDKWPLSIKISVEDFHPNEAGYAAIAEWIYDELISRGWA